MTCSKCGCENITVQQDSRGLPEAHCKDCGAFIKKMGATEVYEYFMANQPDAPKPKKTQCKYCTENYVIRRGRLGNEYYPYKQKYCPECGRQIEEADFSR